MSVIPLCEPFRLDLPITARLQLNDKDAIDRLLEAGLSERIDDFTVERIIEDPMELYKF